MISREAPETSWEPSVKEDLC